MTTVSESKTSRTETRTADSASKLDGASKTAAKTTSGELGTQMANTSTREVHAEAARVTAGDTATDAVETPTHTVQAGDTLTAIARQNQVSLDAVIQANPQISNPNLIHPGDRVNVPGGRPVDGATAPIDPSKELGVQMSGPEVAALQTRLTDLGYNPGPIDGAFGPRTERAVRSFQLNNDLPITGTADQATLDKARSTDARRPDPARDEFPTYRPGSPEQIALFQDAARRAGLPESWASSPGLINILQRESAGQVGRPNYTYGTRSTDPTQWASVHEELRNGQKTAVSSATGLGQLLLSNVDAYYPSGRQGIGNPTEEAIGMMRYIQDRYGNPDEAWRQYGVHHEGY